MDEFARIRDLENMLNGLELSDEDKDLVYETVISVCNSLKERVQIIKTKIPRKYVVFYVGCLDYGKIWLSDKFTTNIYQFCTKFAKFGNYNTDVYLVFLEHLVDFYSKGYSLDVLHQNLTYAFTQTEASHYL